MTVITEPGDVLTADLAYMTERLGAEFEQMAGKRLLITGGAGFLGYYLVQAPLAWNDRHPTSPIEVTVFDNFLRGAPEWLTRLEARSDLTVKAHDIRQPLPDDLGSLDYVIHAAGIASPHVYRQYPIETMDANVGGLRLLLDAAVAQQAAEKPLSGFLFYSSSEIYGDPTPDAIPTPETYRGFVSCTGPRACYDESKRYGETLAVNFARVHSLPISIARPFNNFGPGMKINDGRVIADFCRAVIRGEDIVMFSDGSPTRTFCYVADAVVGYYKVLVGGGAGEPYNVGADGPEVSMAGLAEIVIEEARRLFGYQGGLVRGQSSEADYLVDNPNRRCPDLTKARTQLGYEPSIGLEEGVRRTLQWYRANPEEVGL
jgi:UDP-glucuronate decarboxylase